MEKLLSTKKSSLLSSLVSQNMTLRLTLSIVGLLFIIQTVVLIFISLQAPLVVGLNGVSPTVLANLNDSEIKGPEVRAFILDVLNKKFPSHPSSENLMTVCRYFTEGLRAACENEVKTKKSFIPQDILTQELNWDANNHKATVIAKRFVNVNGTLSAIQSTIRLEIEKRNRTKDNPWGLFIRNWKEEILK